MLAIMLVLYFASRGGMGEGDVKLAPTLGIWLGLDQGLLCLLLAFVSGGVVGAETGDSLRTVFVRSSGCCVFLW